MTEPQAAPIVRFPSFEPHPLIRGPHAQTLAGTYLPGPRFANRATRRVVSLPDGDRTVLHDDCPLSWQPGRRAALLVHGLAGCHGSPYMVRVAGKLCSRGVRTFRMDLRNCGAGVGMARSPYHAGRSGDLRVALEQIGRMCPASPVTLIGFSLGGNMVLKLLGERFPAIPGRIDSAVAVNPPVDLQACVEAISRPEARWYDRHFVRLLYRQVRRIHRQHRVLPDYPFKNRPRRLLEFDECYTAPVCGFGSVADYYSSSSAAQFLPGISVPTLILASRDDPLVPVDTFAELALPESVHLHIAESGGHLGFVARSGADPDRRWMDWRILDWVDSLEHSNGQAAAARGWPARSAGAAAARDFERLRPQPS